MARSPITSRRSGAAACCSFSFQRLPDLPRRRTSGYWNLPVATAVQDFSHLHDQRRADVQNSVATSRITSIASDSRRLTFRDNVIRTSLMPPARRGASSTGPTINDTDAFWFHLVVLNFFSRSMARNPPRKGVQRRACGLYGERRYQRAKLRPYNFSDRFLHALCFGARGVRGCT